MGNNQQQIGKRRRLTSGYGAVAAAARQFTPRPVLDPVSVLICWGSFVAVRCYVFCPGALKPAERASYARACVRV